MYPEKASMKRIKLLKDCPEYAAVLAYWSYNLWYRTRPIDYDTIIAAYRQRARDGAIPLSWVAVEESMPVGMATLKENDLWSRKDLNPWLASLYVVPEFRRRGLAGELIDSVTGKARELGLERVYLFLGHGEEMDLAAFYTRRGWRYLEDAHDNDGRPTKIFYYPL